jgi:hypothetical protein
MFIPADAIFVKAKQLMTSAITPLELATAFN